MRDVLGFTGILSLVVLWSVLAAGWTPHAAANAGTVAGPSTGEERPAEQSEAEDCPLLPGCPGDIPVPLPPAPRLTESESAPKSFAPFADGKHLSDGTGKYRDMVLIPAGTFDLGSPDGEGRPDERPSRKIFQKAFYLSKHEVTASEFCEFLNSQGENARDGIPRIKLDCPDCPVAKIGNTFKPMNGMADKPMVCVSWYGAMDYAQWASTRLPTSIEWERAAALTTPYPPADHLTILSREASVPVQIATPGVRGIAGMIGNVWQWCSDWYEKDYYAKCPSTNPPGPSLGNEKNIRGGSWASAECSKRIRNRHKANPRGYFRTVGFRVVKD